MFYRVILAIAGICLLFAKRQRECGLRSDAGQELSRVQGHLHHLQDESRVQGKPSVRHQQHLVSRCYSHLFEVSSRNVKFLVDVKFLEFLDSSNDEKNRKNVKIIN